ncbi:hypothetical protein BDQ17DRAFT_1365260 [Cyathus striatus]|nr:hypothetical protein BDQ17DRAFT_1365260 [Cyathus striatus]
MSSKELQEVVTLSYLGMKQNMVYAAALTTMIYEIGYTLTEEVEYIWWGVGWSFPKFLYIIIRYYVPTYLLVESVLPFNMAAGHLSTNICKATIWFHGFGGLVIINTCVDFIFVLRVSALYGNSLRIVLFLAFALLADFTATFLVTLFISISDAQHVIAVPIAGCRVGLSTTEDFLDIFQSIALGTSLTVDTILFLLTVGKPGMNFIHDNGGLRNVFMHKTKIKNVSPLLSTIVLDGTLYFFVLFVSTVTVTMASVVPQLVAVDAIEFVSPFYLTVLSSLGSRLILKLRKMSSPDNTNERDLLTVSQPIVFAQDDVSEVENGSV